MYPAFLIAYHISLFLCFPDVLQIHASPIVQKSSSVVIKDTFTDEKCGPIRQSVKAELLSNMVLKVDSSTGLGICKTSSTCCSVESQLQLSHLNRNKILETINSQLISKIVEPFKAKGLEIREFMLNLMEEAEVQLHNIFTRTYGVLYERNALLFRTYFRHIRTFYEDASIDLESASSAFFTELYQKMFQVMNSKYSLDDTYLTCVATHMKLQQPFGDIPRKVSTSLKRSLTATRTLVQTLLTSQHIFESLSDSKKVMEDMFDSTCLKELDVFNVCPTCSTSDVSVGCSSVCVQIVRRCLSTHFKIEEDWNVLIDAMMQISDRLTGPFNVETIILPLDINISDAIMNFQEMGFQVTQKVFDACGTPKFLEDDTNVHAAIPSSTASLNKGSTSSVSTSNLDKLGMAIQARFGRRSSRFRRDVLEQVTEGTKNQTTESGVKHHLSTLLAQANSEIRRRSVMNKQKFGDASNPNDIITPFISVDVERKTGAKYLPSSALRKQLKKKNLSPIPAKQSSFEKLMSELKRTVRATTGIWRQMPLRICAALRGNKTSSSHTCLKEEEIDTLKETESFTDDAKSDVDSQFTSVSNKMRVMIQQLRRAHMGQGVEWWNNDLSVDIPLASSAHDDADSPSPFFAHQRSNRNYRHEDTNTEQPLLSLSGEDDPRKARKEDTTFPQQRDDHEYEQYADDYYRDYYDDYDGELGSGSEEYNNSPHYDDEDSDTEYSDDEAGGSGSIYESSDEYNLDSSSSYDIYDDLETLVGSGGGAIGGVDDDYYGQYADDEDFDSGSGAYEEYNQNSSPSSSEDESIDDYNYEEESEWSPPWTQVDSSSEAPPQSQETTTTKEVMAIATSELPTVEISTNAVDKALLDLEDEDDHYDNEIDESPVVDERMPEIVGSHANKMLSSVGLSMSSMIFVIFTSYCMM